MFDMILFGSDVYVKFGYFCLVRIFMFSSDAGNVMKDDQGIGLTYYVLNM